ncbi:hypothetical protein G6F42_019315 [Rhizopus arrhizus]|nr:hypothetical protein G6F42_019315 [Rhizopus arrhizus]
MSSSKLNRLSIEWNLPFGIQRTQGLPITTRIASSSCIDHVVPNHAVMARLGPTRILRVRDTPILDLTDNITTWGKIPLIQIITKQRLPSAQPRFAFRKALDRFLIKKRLRYYEYASTYALANNKRKRRYGVYAAAATAARNALRAYPAAKWQESIHSGVERFVSSGTRLGWRSLKQIGHTVQYNKVNRYSMILSNQFDKKTMPS